MSHRTKPCRPLAAAAAAIVLVAACAAPPPAPVAPEGAPPDFPDTTVSGTSGDSWWVDADASELRALVYRGGALSRLGHDHVLDGRGLGGLVRVDELRNGERKLRGDFYLPLASFEVDNPESRRDVSFDTEPDDDAREGTRRNMLKSLDAASHPWARVLLTADLPEDAQPATVTAAALIRLAGGEHRQSVEVRVELTDDTLTGAGEFQLRHSDLGIEPFSVMGGALAVKDVVDVRFRIRAIRR